MVIVDRLIANREANTEPSVSHFMLGYFYQPDKFNLVYYTLHSFDDAKMTGVQCGVNVLYTALPVTLLAFLALLCGMIQVPWT